MDIILIIIAGILLLIGVAGCILPAVPGTPLCYISILLLHFTSKIDFSLQFLLIWAGIIVIVQILDYYLPIWTTKKFGGSRYGTIGSAIGLLVGLFIAPWGIIIGPFAGAVIGELISGRSTSVAFKAGMGAFTGFLAGTVIKLTIAGFLVFYFVQALIHI